MFSGQSASRTWSSEDGAAKIVNYTTVNFVSWTPTNLSQVLVFLNEVSDWYFTIQEIICQNLHRVVMVVKINIDLCTY